MYVESIRLINFRNYNNLNIVLNKKINVFIGKNAQGKTNLLEAIYICGTGRSFKTNRDREIINFNKDEAYIGANIHIEPYDKFIEIKMHRDRPKRIRINKRELKNYKELDSGLNVVVFSPEDLRIVKDGPQERRNFMDLGISQIRPVYSHNLSKYNKIIFQRNNLLKSHRFKDDLGNLLEIFDFQLSKIATSIIMERVKYIEELSNICNNIHRDLTEGQEKLQLKLISNVEILENRKDMEENYLKLLKNNMDKDIKFGTTQIGPHRDDILININNKDAKTYGSQGQQRTVILSIKLSEVEFIKKQRGKYPVLLLDDVFSELDEDRRKYLINSFKDMQTLITGTDAIDLTSMESIEKSIFHIEDGRLI